MPKNKRAITGSWRRVLHLAGGAIFAPLAAFFPAIAVMAALFGAVIALLFYDKQATLYFVAIGFVIAVYPDKPLVAILAIIALSVGDFAASLFGDGKRTKSLRGSFACYTSLSLLFSLALPAWQAIPLAGVATVAEYVGGENDNALIPIWVALIAGWLV